jgi:hypothetical protein
VALAFVKATKLESGSGTSWGGSVSVTGGNLLVSGSFTGYGTIGTGINTTDASGSNTWTQDANGTHTYTGTPSKNAFSVSSAPNAAAGTYTVTLTPQGGATPSGGTASIFELSGAATASPRDAVSPGLTFADPSANVVTASLTNATADAVFVAMFGSNQSTGTATVSEIGTGWTQPANGVETNATSFYVFGMAYKIVATAGAQSNSWTITSQGWGALVAAYKAGTAGSTAERGPPNPGMAVSTTQRPVARGWV